MNDQGQEQPQYWHPSASCYYAQPRKPSERWRCVGCAKTFKFAASESLRAHREKCRGLAKYRGEE